MAGGDFLINVRTQFTSSGLEEIVAQARTALAQLGNVPAGRRAEAALGVQSAAESRILAIKNQQLGALDPASASFREDFSRITQQVGAVRRNLTVAFKEMADGTANLVPPNLAGLPAAIKAKVVQAQADLETALQEFSALKGQKATSVYGAIGQVPTDRASLDQLRSALGREATTAGPGAPPGAAADAEALAAETRAKQESVAATQEALAADTRYAEIQARLISAKQEIAAKTAEAVAADAGYAEATGRAANARRATAANVQAATLGTNLTGIGAQDTQAIEVANSVRARIEANLQAAAIARASADREGVAGQELAASQAERRLADRALAAAERAEARQEVEASIARGEGTAFQRAQAQFQRPGGTQRLPEEFQTGGQFLGNRFATTAGFAVAGTALYGSVRVIGDMLKESENLDRVLNQIKVTLENTGQAGSGAFNQARQGILDIAKETGIASDQVAGVFQKFQGAFGSGGIPAVLAQTRAAMETVAVTGLSLEQVFETLTPVAKAFDTGINTITDSALGLQERLGVSAKDTITFVSDLAPVAKEAGASLQDLAALGAVAQQVTGKAAAASAADLARTIPGLQAAQDKIIQFFDLPQLKGKKNQILVDFATGNTFDVLKEITKDFHLLTTAQQEALVASLGSKREFATLTAVFQNGAKAVAEWDGNATNLGKDNGKTQQYFDKLQSSVSQTIKVFSELGKQIGAGLFSSGLATFLVQIITLAGSAVGVINSLVGAWSALNDKTGGVATTFVLLLGVMKLIGPAISFLTDLVLGKTVADLANANAQNVVAAATSRVSALTGEETAVEALNTAAVETNTAANAGRSGGLLGGALTKAGLRPAAGAAATEGAVLAEDTASVSLGARLGAGAKGLGGAIVAAAPVLVAFELVTSFMGDTAKAASAATAESEKAKAAIQAAQAGHGAQGESPEQAIARLRAEASAADARGGGIPQGPGRTGFLPRAEDYLGGKLINLLGGSGDNAVRAGLGQQSHAAETEAAITAQLTATYEPLFVQAIEFRKKELITALSKADLSAVNNVLKTDTKKIGGISITGDFNDKVLQAVAGTSGDKSKIEASDLTPDNLKKLLADAQKGGINAGKIIQLIFDFLGGVKGDLFSKAATAQTAADAGGQTYVDLAKAKKEYDAGGVGPGNYLEALQAQTKSLQERIAVDLQQGTGGLNALTGHEADLADAKKALSAIQAKRYDDQIAALKSYESSLGVGASGTGAEQTAVLAQEIAILTAKISDKTLNIDDRAKSIDALYKALRDKWQHDVDAIADPIAKEKALDKGFDIPPQLRQLEAAIQVQADPATSKFVHDLGEITHEDLQTYFNQIADEVVNGAKSAKQAVLDAFENAVLKLTSGIHGALGELAVSPADQAKFDDLIQKIRDLNNTPDSAFGTPVKTGTKGYAATSSATNKADTRAATNAANAALAKAQADGDPVATAEANLQSAREALANAKPGAETIQAQAQILDAQHALRDAQNDILKADIEALVNLHKRDPVNAARAQVQAAQEAVATAKGAAARIRADNQLKDAEQALADAMFDITLARIEQAQAVDVAAGNTVGAATEAVKAAYAKMNKILADPNSSQADLIRAQTGVITAQASERDAKFQDQLDTIDFMKQMEQIGTQQAIAMLEQMLTIPNLTKKEIESLQLKIHQLQQESKANFQFNLPQNIDLPTLYEARRLNQTPGGSSYNDNRVVTVNFTANNNTDAHAVANTIVDGFSAPSRYGTAPRMY